MSTSIFEQIQSHYHRYGFVLLISLSLFFIGVLCAWNLWQGKKGKYTWFKNKIVNKNNDNFIFTLDPADAFTSKLELKTKMLLQAIFKKPFVRIRPDFLNNPVTGKNLELDLYNRELNLACEVNGNQHYKYTPHFHSKGKEQFYNQQYRDEIKRMKCKEKGICLIEIPYDVGEKGLKDFLLMELRKNKYLV